MALETPPLAASLIAEEAASVTARSTGTVSVLSVSPHDDDHRKLEFIFSHSNWNLSRAYACEEAVEFVRRHHTPVVISEKELAGKCWRNMLRRLNALEFYPAPRLIVSARLADDELWSEVLNLGGYNVLEKPFDLNEVFWVVSHAWLDWKSENERAQSKQWAPLTHGVASRNRLR